MTHEPKSKAAYAIGVVVAATLAACVIAVLIAGTFAVIKVLL